MRIRILPLLAFVLLPACAQDDVVSANDASSSQLVRQASAAEHWGYDAPVNNRFYAPCISDTLVMTGTITYKIGVVSTTSGRMLIRQSAKPQLDPVLQVLSGTYWQYAGGAFEQWVHIDAAGQDKGLIQNIMLTNSDGGRLLIQRNIFVNINANGQLVESRPAVYTCKSM